MKHLKMLGLLAVAAASMMAFASSASATPILTSPAGTGYFGEIHATLATPNSALLKAGIEDTCGESTVKGNVTVNETNHASGAITKLSFADCNRKTVVLSEGSLEINTGGVVTAVGSKVTVEELGISCVYGGGTGTPLGTLTPGSPAVLEVNAELPKQEGGFFCANKGIWTANYTVTTPNPLLIDS